MIEELIARYFWMDGYGPWVWAAWVVAGAGIKGYILLQIGDALRTRRELDRLTSTGSEAAVGSSSERL